MTAVMTGSADGALATVLGALRDVKRNGSQGYLALCPVHQADKPHGTRPSLLVSEGGKGVVAHCYAGCQFRDIVAALGLPRDAWFYRAVVETPAVHPRAYRVGDAPARPTSTASPKPARRAPTEADIVQAYAYTTADGALLYENVRYMVDGAKDFRQRRPDDDGGWIYSLGREGEGGVPRVLYRLPEVVDAASEGRRVYLVEGEKDVETLRALGLTATTSGSATTWRRAFADALKGADVVILPDADAPGETYAQRALDDLAAAGASARIVRLPGLAAGEDVTDWLTRHGHTGAELETLASPARRYRMLSDVLGDEALMRPPAAVVPGLAWEGRSTLLVAREKAGKSTIGGAICAAVSRGGPWLDGTCLGGPVLVLTLEEHIADTAARLADFGADGDRVALVQLDGITGPAGRIAELRQRIAEVRPVLVFVDSFTRICDDTVEDFNAIGQTGPVAYALTDVAHDTGVAVVIVHHANKSGGAHGSTAITAGVDVWADVASPEGGDDPTVRTINPKGRVRGLRPVTLQYLDEDAGGPAFRLAGQAPTLVQRVAHYLRSHPGASQAMVCKAIGVQWQAAVDALRSLEAAGLVTHEAAGRGHAYTLTPAGERAR